MAQVTILPAGQTPATSTDIIVGEGQAVTVGIFAAGGVPGGAVLDVLLDSPGEDVLYAQLSRGNHATALVGAGTYRIKRGNIERFGVDVGAFTEGA